MPNHDPEYLFFSLDNPQSRYLAPIFGDLSQREKNSEIKPPLPEAHVSVFAFAVIPMHRIDTAIGSNIF